MQDEKLEKTVKVLEKSKADLEKKWLTFWLEKQLYGVSITNVEQIVSMQPVTEVPEYPPYAKGIISLRGAILPVIDLRVRLGKPEAEYTDHTCIVINRVEDEQLGFIVDEVDAVVDIPGQSIAPPPKMGEDRVNRYLTGITRIQDDEGREKIVLCLDTAKLLLSDELKTLEAYKGEMGS